MTPAELHNSHERMAQFLLHLLRFADKKGRASRTPVVEVHYQRALQLVREAGLSYDPPKEY